MAQKKHSEGWRDRETIDAKAVAEILSLSVSGVHSLAARGKIPGAKKVGSKLRVVVAAFAAWLDDPRRSPAA